MTKLKEVSPTKNRYRLPCTSGDEGWKTYLSPMNVIRWILFALLFSLPFKGNCQDIPNGHLNSPYEAVLQHLYWLQSAHYEPQLAAEAFWQGGDSLLNLKRAVQLKQILDGKGLYVRLERVPRESNYVDSITGQTRYTLFPLELPEVYVSLQDGKWRYSAYTWQQIPQLHRQVYPFGVEQLVNVLGSFSTRKFLGIEVWQWIGILALPLTLFLLYWLFYFLLFPFLRTLFRRFGFYKPEEVRTLQHFDRYVSLWILHHLAIIAIPTLILPVWLNAWLIHGIRIAGWILVLMIGLRFIDLVFGFLLRRREATGNQTEFQLLPIIKKIAQILLWLLILVPVLRLLEVNLTALIAGLSIGGLALALAAQDTVKNLISTVLIFFDHPYRLGDYIKAAGVEGTVVEIGFRSTRMMTIDSSIITIPNSNMINDQVINLGVRQFRLINFMIGVVYGTTTSELERFIHHLRVMTQAHPDVVKENVMIYLSSLNNSSIDIRYRIPITVFDIRLEYRVQEELVFGIIETARSLGIQFAFPSQSVYIEQYPDLAKGNTEEEPDDWTKKQQTLVEKLISHWSNQRLENQP